MYNFTWKIMLFVTILTQIWLEGLIFWVKVSIWFFIWNLLEHLGVWQNIWHSSGEIVNIVNDWQWHVSIVSFKFEIFSTLFLWVILIFHRVIRVQFFWGLESDQLVKVGCMAELLGASTWKVMKFNLNVGTYNTYFYFFSFTI